MLKKTIIYLCLLLIAITLTKCNKDSSENASTVFELTTETVVLDDSNNENIVSITESEIIFNNQDSKINQLQVNNIIVADVSDNAPNGFLRKITNIETLDNQIKLTTTNATLTDAIKNGAVSFNETINPNDVISVDTSGQELNRNSNFLNSEFSFEINRTFDLDGNSNTTDDRIKFEGDIDFNPSFEFDVDIKNKNVEYFFCRFHV